MVVKKTKRKLGDLSVDEFMKSGFDSDVTDNDEEVKPSRQKDGQTDKAPHTTSLSTKRKKTSKKMKDSISVLQKADPEFYKFLEEEDKTLLEFSEDEGLDDSDSDKSDSDDSVSEDGSEEENDELLKKLEAMESDSDEDFDETSEPGRNKSVHKPPDKLEVAAHVESSSDEDGDEDTKEGGSDGDSPKHKLPVKSKNLVTLKMVKGWSEKLKSTGSLKALRHLKKAFKAAVHVAGSDQGEASNYKVEGSKVFNAIVRACLSHVIPALEKALALPKQDIGSDKPVLPSASKNWRKVSADVKGYLSAVLELLSHMSETGVVDVVLKHAHRLVPYYAAFPRLARVVLKKMIGLWGSGEETSRLLAFLCIIKLLRTHKDSMLEFCLKRMYMTYVKNCKFTSPSSLPLINFMQRSLVEVLGMDVNLCYQYGFIYIRQLAIHLRNAITIKKKDNCQAVYNWQYIHCLHLWARVLSSLHPNDVLQHLIYPLTETTIGVIKLLPTARYYPLRFHCVRTLNLLSASTDTFIPVLPFLLEVFEQTDFNKRHKSISLKPFNFACIIKLSKSQLVEKAFRDGVVDQLYELLLDTFTIHAHCVGFPELVLPAVIQLKDFLKKCKVANYCKQMRQVLEKVEETSRVISQRRKSAVFRLADKAAVDAWERKSKEEGTPLGKYYATWRKLRDRELQHEIAGKERLSMEFDQFPEIVRRKTPAKASAEDRKEFSELFESDSEDSGDESRFLLKEERSGPPRKKSKKGTEDSEEEDYSDFDSDELEQLAGSAGESDDDEANDSDDADEPEQMDENKDDSDGEESDDIDKEDVVKDFTFSSDED